MMILRSAPPSPFGRKVKIAAHLLNLYHEIEIIPANTMDPQDALRHQNPLGKIPALIMESGDVLYDSRVIIEYLDGRAGGGVILPKGAQRFPVLTAQALADGIMDAAILQIYETRWREEPHRHEGWLAHQNEKVQRGLRYFENHLPELTPHPQADAIALACALGYLDLRFNGMWREHHPNLVKWLESFAKAVPAFAETAV
jgi:glutathione S-transferase